MYQSPSSFLAHGLLEKEKASESAEWAWNGVLRGLLWRLKLGVLPSYSPSIEELRRAAADGRRRYAELRRRLLVDPHSMEEAHKSHQSNMDNPLSQDPESVWGRYFQIAELEETIDKDLTRLYPEHGSFFQSPVFQAMLRRILLVWSLMHPDYSYRQGMHELLAPLLYVLHCDVVHLSEVKEIYGDLFDDRFEEPFYLERKTHENGGKQRGQRIFCSKKVTTIEGSSIRVDVDSLEGISAQNCVCLKLDELSSGLRIMVLGNDTYGAEGELGILLSGRFVEHDAYSMFDALMCGKGGGVNTADYFLAVPACTTGLSPALEASSLLYKALAAADLSLYSHLKGLGVEPQFFALRWIRVLFGREFDLQKLLILWDAIFSVAETSDTNAAREGSVNSFQHSPRRAFILALAISMLLYLRLTLLAAPGATGCLQKLLNFPQNAEIKVLIESAKNLIPLVEEAARILPGARQYTHTYETRKARKSVQSVQNKSSFQGHTISSMKLSPEIFSRPFPDFYWEEKWKNCVLQKDVPRKYEETKTQGDMGSSQRSAIANGTDHLLDSASAKNTWLREANKDKIIHSCNHNLRVLKCNLDGSAVESSNPAGSNGLQEALQDGLARLQDTDRCGESTVIACGASELNDVHEGSAKSEQAIFSAAKSNKSTSESVMFRFLRDPNATRSYPAEVPNLPRIITRHESTNGNASTAQVLLGHRSPGPLECIQKDMGSIVHPTTHHARHKSEGNESSSEVPLPAPKLKASSQPRKYWMWSFGKSRSQEDKKASLQSKFSKEPTKVVVIREGSCADNMSQSGKEEPVFKNERTKSVNNHVNEPCSVSHSATLDTQDEINESVSPQAGLLESMSSISILHADANAGHVTDLGTLGQSIYDNIQVIEAALSLIIPPGTENGLIEDTAVLGERSDNPHKSTLGEMGPETVQAALAELRKISNELLHM